MGKMHISLPDDLHAALDAACERFSLHRPKLMQRGIRLALSEAEALHKAAAGAPPPPRSMQAATGPAKAPAVTFAPSSEFNINLVPRGTTLWLRLDQLLDVLDVKEAELLAKIDEEDDVLDYIGKRWVATLGFAEAQAMCPDPALAARVRAWADAQARLLFNGQEVADATA